MTRAPKVLVVDDENQILVLVKHALERSGFAVVTLSDPTLAVATATRERPQIILSDLMMPRLDGYGLLRDLRQDPLTATIPVAFLSAAPPTENMQKAFAHGVVGYFEKPFHPARLGQQLRELLSDVAQRKDELHGSLRSTSLQFIVDMMAREHRTGVLNIRAGELRGRVVFKNGQAKDAMLGRARGELALSELNRLKDGEFTLSAIDGAQADVIELGESDFLADDLGGQIPDLDPGDPIDQPMILVVDDESDIVKMIERALSRGGYRVITAANGRLALKRAVDARPDVVICDIMMPEMDGWHFYHRLRADYRINEARFVFLSAYPDLDQRLREVGVNADGYLAKGALLGALLQRIEQLLKPRRELASLFEKTPNASYAGRVEPLGIKHVLRLLHARHYTGVVTLENVWHKITCELDQGQPVSVQDDGMVESSAALAFEEMCAQTVGELLIAPASPHLKQNIRIPFEQLMLEAEADLTQAEQRVVDTNLVSATAVWVDERVLEFYSQLAPSRLTPVLDAIRARKLPRDIVASIDMPPTEIEEVLRDLVRKRILGFDAVT